METVTIHHKGETQTAPADAWQATADDMVRRLGTWEPGVSRVEHGETVSQALANGARNSTFGGELVHDDAARQRIEQAHDALRGAGVNVDASRQLYATGTRMADIGYATQATRAAEHAAKMPLREAAARLSDTIAAERRRDIEITAGELGKRLDINGALRFEGYKLREQAVRGLLGRIGSPALSYVLGVRERMTADDATPEQKAADRGALLDVMQRELARYCDVPVKLRVRDGMGDAFAAVSPSYAPADAPSVLGDVLAALPDDARASFAYDAATTAWELRASVFTPTPVDEQAVGEPFEGYVSFQSRDNGTRTLTGGGGILLLACLNASTYAAASSSVSRRHVGAILADLAAMSRDASRAIHTLCAAWGTARADALPVNVHDASGILLPLDAVIPGFYRHMLTARRGELVGVLPGRTAQHVEKLSAAYFAERRNPTTAVRADLAQGFTRYVQDMPTPVRRDAEQAIGQWLVSGERVAYAAA
jgi:hypothetical protein